MRLQAGINDKGQRLDHFLARHLEQITRSQLQHLNRSGAVHIEGRVEKSGYRLRGNEVIEVDLVSLERSPLKPEQIPLQIYFEDEDLAVIEKPAGLVVHPGAGIQTGTVVHALLHHFQELSSLGEECRPGIVHRIDKWTSGLLVIAKNNQAHASLGKAFQERHVEKTYSALVHGKVLRSSGVIDMSIARHSTIRTRMAASTERGRTAHTEYVVVKRFHDFTLVDVKIKTGRTHQIRVHLSAIGHPVVGDDVYGEKQCEKFAKKYGPLNRYFLHAARLQFQHPRTGKALEFHSPLPPELENLLTRIKA
jgi:23S rRNA pseudouridine1911/1915/1917 synthase